jgi:hypothetical protein
MAAGNTYVAIATQTVSSSVSSVTFSSIPQTYTDLVIVLNPINAGTSDIWCTFNTDTSTNYSSTWLAGTGTAAASYRISNNARFYFDYASVSSTTASNSYIMNLMNYANTTTYKSAIIRGNSPAYATEAAVGLWRSTAAINQIIITAVTNFQSGSTLSIYGILAA